MAIKIFPGEYVLENKKMLKRVITKFKNIYSKLDYDAYIYIDINIRNLTVDFLLIDSNYGILLGKVKEEENTRQVINEIADELVMFSRSFESLALSEKTLLDEQFSLKINIFKCLFLSDANNTEVKNSNINIVYNDRNFELSSFFSSKVNKLSIGQISVIRTLICPEVKIGVTEKNENTSELIATLDLEQEEFAKRVSYGHYWLSGIPGSGKTVALIARAVHILRENKDWKVLIVTYNKSLTKKLENRINFLKNDLNYHNISLNKLEITNFHKFALKIANMSVPQRPSQGFWDEELAEYAIEKLKKSDGIYDAILIDEYQDFRNSWINACVFALNKSTNNENKNLFIAGDRLQSIYNSSITNWKQDIGIDMRGKSKILKKSYRSASDHIKLSLEFLKTDADLQSEVIKFYDGEEGIENVNISSNSIGFFEGYYKEIDILLDKLINGLGYKYKDILVLADSWKVAEDFQKILSPSIRNYVKIGKDIDEECLNVTTYHSSKGLENKIVILLNINNIDDKKLIYVGMTRASERLYIHSDSYEFGNAYILKELASKI